MEFAVEVADEMSDVVLDNDGVDPVCYQEEEVPMEDVVEPSMNIPMFDGRVQCLLAEELKKGDQRKGN